MENYTFDTGLTIMIDNPSFNQILSINDIKNPEIYPYQNNVPIVNSYQSPQNNYFKSTSNIFYYHLKLNQKQDNYLVLPQSFNKGWVAFYFDGLKPVFLKNHTLINEWANGWEISTELKSSVSTNVYLVFWPQILEFIGFGFTIITLICVYKSKK